MSSLQSAEDVESKFQAFRLADAPRKRRTYAAFITKTDKERIFIYCMHKCYAFDRTEVKFPKGIKAGWWIGFERADDGGKREPLQNIKKVYRAHPLFDVIIDPKFRRIVYVHVKMIKRNLSIHPHLATRVTDGFVQTIPEEFWCEEIGGFEDPEGISDKYKEEVLYNAIVELEMDLEEWNAGQRNVHKVKKTLFWIGSLCPKEEAKKLINTPWMRELMTVDCISDNNEMKSPFRTGLIIEERYLVSLNQRLLTLWDPEIGKIQVKLENPIANQVLPDKVLGKLFKFKTNTISIDDEKGYKMKVAVPGEELEPAKNNLICKFINVDMHHRYTKIMPEVILNCPVGFDKNEFLYMDHAFLGEIKIGVLELRREFKNQGIEVDFERLAGKQIPVYLQLLDDINKWDLAELDEHKVELAIET